MTRKTLPDPNYEIAENAEKGYEGALEAPRRRLPRWQAAHQQAQVVVTGVHEHAFKDVGVTAQVDAAHGASDHTDA